MGAMENDRWTVSCPECDCELVIDRATGKVLIHRAAKQAVAGGATFEGLMDEMELGQERAEDIFAQEVAAHENQDRILSDRFEEALKIAEETADEEMAPRPIDLD